MAALGPPNCPIVFTPESHPRFNPIRGTTSGPPRRSHTPSCTSVLWLAHGKATDGTSKTTRAHRRVCQRMRVPPTNDSAIPLLKTRFKLPFHAIWGSNPMVTISSCRGDTTPNLRDSCSKKLARKSLERKVLEMLHPMIYPYEPCNLDLLSRPGPPQLHMLELRRQECEPRVQKKMLGTPPPKNK